MPVGSNCNPGPTTVHHGERGDETEHLESHCRFDVGAPGCRNQLLAHDETGRGILTRARADDPALDDDGALDVG